MFEQFKLTTCNAQCSSVWPRSAQACPPTKHLLIPIYKTLITNYLTNKVERPVEYNLTVRSGAKLWSACNLSFWQILGVICFILWRFGKAKLGCLNSLSRLGEFWTERSTCPALGPWAYFSLSGVDGSHGETSGVRGLKGHPWELRGIKRCQWT